MCDDELLVDELRHKSIFKHAVKILPLEVVVAILCFLAGVAKIDQGKCLHYGIGCELIIISVHNDWQGWMMQTFVRGDN